MWNPLADKLKKEFRWDFIKGLAHDGEKPLPSIGTVTWAEGQRVAVIHLNDETVDELEAERSAVAHYDKVTGGQEGARK